MENLKRILSLLQDENEKKISGSASDIKMLNPLILAHVGDAYFSLFAREKLISFGEIKVNDLHKMASEIVSAPSQKKAYILLEKMLTDEEKAIYKRGRNTKSHAKKNTDVTTYHMSTGFEAILGYAYLTRNFERLNELCEVSFRGIVEELTQ